MLVSLTFITLGLSCLISKNIKKKTESNFKSIENTKINCKFPPLLNLECISLLFFFANLEAFIKSLLFVHVCACACERQTVRESG